MPLKLISEDAARRVRDAVMPGDSVGFPLAREALLVPAPQGAVCRCCGSRITKDDWAIKYPFEELDIPSGRRTTAFIHSKPCKA